MIAIYRDYRMLATDGNDGNDGTVEVLLHKTNYLFLSEMRLYFDTLFERSALWKGQQRYLKRWWCDPRAHDNRDRGRRALARADSKRLERIRPKQMQGIRT